MKNNQTTTNRINELYMAIVSNEKPKPRIRKVFSYSNNKKPQHFYVVTISKNELSFVQRINNFNNLLIDNLKPNENLAYNNDCFCIASDEYEISYILEGYYKQANKKGYIITELQMKSYYVEWALNLQLIMQKSTVSIIWQSAKWIIPAGRKNSPIQQTD